MTIEAIQWVATAIQTASEKSPLAVYMYLSRTKFYKLSAEPSISASRAKRLLTGVHPTKEEIDILSDVLEIEPCDVKLLTCSKPSPKDFEEKHQYMLSPGGAPYIVSDFRATREMEGWTYITLKKTIELLKQKNIKQQHLKIVIENPMTNTTTTTSTEATKFYAHFISGDVQSLEEWQAEDYRNEWLEAMGRRDAYCEYRPECEWIKKPTPTPAEIIREYIDLGFLIEVRRTETDAEREEYGEWMDADK